MGQRLVINFYSEKGGKRLANVYMHWSAYTSSAIAITNGIIDSFLEGDINEKLSLTEIVSAIRDGIMGSKLQWNDRLYLREINSKIPTTFKEYIYTLNEAFEKQDVSILINAGIPKYIFDSKVANNNVKLILKDYQEYLEKNDEELECLANSYSLPEIIRDFFEEEFLLSRNAGLISITKDEMEMSNCWQEGNIEFYLKEKEVFFDTWWTQDISDLEISKFKSLEDTQEFKSVKDTSFNKNVEFIEVDNKLYRFSWEDRRYKLVPITSGINCMLNITNYKDFKKASQEIESLIANKNYCFIIDGYLISVAE